MSFYNHSNNFWVQKHIYDQMNGTAERERERALQQQRYEQSVAATRTYHIAHEKQEIRRAYCEPTPRNTGATVMYRYFCANGELLYIGITCTKDSRHKAHSKYSPWFVEHDRVEYVEFPQRTLAEKAEKAAIQKERPRWNVIHNGVKR